VHGIDSMPAECRQRQHLTAGNDCVACRPPAHKPLPSRRQPGARQHTILLPHGGPASAHGQPPQAGRQAAGRQPQQSWCQLRRASLTSSSTHTARLCLNAQVAAVAQRSTARFCSGSGHGIAAASSCSSRHTAAPGRAAAAAAVPWASPQPRRLAGRPLQQGPQPGADGLQAAAAAQCGPVARAA
jgi:hypothetical protein